MAGAAWYFQAVSSCSEEVAAVHRKDFIIPPGDVTRKPDDPSFVQKVVKCGLVEMCKKKDMSF